jgi:hypothetical protein
MGRFLKSFPRPCLTYANVVATLALFLAIGGTSYAALTINGSQIQNRTIGGQKLKFHTVGAAEIDGQGVTVSEADRVAQLVVSKANRSPPRHGSIDGAAGFRPNDVIADTDTEILLSVGQTAPVFQAGPFTITAGCVEPGDGSIYIQIYATSSDAGWYAEQQGGSSPGTEVGPWAAGQTITIFNSNWPEAGGILFTLPGGLPLLSADGSLVTLDGAFGTNLEAPCSLSLYAIQ